MFMQSNGGLVDAQLFQGKDAILSGPAGGVVGMARTATEAGFDQVIGFDMGGTSTDVSHFNGEYERSQETMVAGIRLRAPMMNIHTVAAGGGSILHFDGTRYRVGPDSAGANPGPASYGRGGPLTVTDANVMVGKLQPHHFPAVFGPDGTTPLDADVVQRRFAELAVEIGEATGTVPPAPEDVAEGFLRIAVENMANAIKKISVERGYDVSGYTLNTFGGAGGQHACLVADSLGMNRVLLHPFAGVLSAYGMGLAEIRSIRERQVELPLDDDTGRASFELALAELATVVSDDLTAQDVPAERVNLIRRVHLRYAGSDTALAIEPAADVSIMVERFEQVHQQRFGYIAPGRDLVIEAVSVEGVGGGEEQDDGAAWSAPTAGSAPAAVDAINMHTGGEMQHASVFRRDELAPGQPILGPAIITEQIGTIVVEPGWQAEVTDRGDCVLTRVVARAASRSHWHRCRPGDARGLQQPVHEHRRADGRNTGQHRVLGEHQGAATTSPARSSPLTAAWWPTHRTCRCTWGRWARRSRQSSVRTRRTMKPGDVLRHQRAVQRRNPSARRHGDQPGVRPCWEPRFCSTSRRVVTTQTSAAGHRVPRRLTAPRSMRKVC